jgi:hypothetical protein
LRSGPGVYQIEGPSGTISCGVGRHWEVALGLEAGDVFRTSTSEGADLHANGPSFIVVWTVLVIRRFAGEKARSTMEEREVYVGALRNCYKVSHRMNLEGKTAVLDAMNLSRVN